MSLTISNGFVTHRNDFPLKPKCVATIGSPKSYLPGVVGLAGQPLKRTQKSYAALAREFYAACALGV